MSLLTETADYDEGGSWGRASNGWPEIKGDQAYDMYVFANCVADTIPYGSYVLMSANRKQYNETDSCLRVQSAYIKKLRADFKAAGEPNSEESVKRRGRDNHAKKWW